MKDLQRSVDYVYARPDLDESRLAFFGVSLGAALWRHRAGRRAALQGGDPLVGRISECPRLPEADRDQFRAARADARAHAERA